ncbi:hypothetical protein U1Q18_051637 [Sarracenia purpurea var. burkii]
MPNGSARQNARLTMPSSSALRAASAAFSTRRRSTSASVAVAGRLCVDVMLILSESGGRPPVQYWPSVCEKMLPIAVSLWSVAIQATDANRLMWSLSAGKRIMTAANLWGAPRMAAESPCSIPGGAQAPRTGRRRSWHRGSALGHCPSQGGLWRPCRNSERRYPGRPPRYEERGLPWRRKKENPEAGTDKRRRLSRTGRKKSGN